VRPSVRQDYAGTQLIAGALYLHGRRVPGMGTADAASGSPFQPAVSIWCPLSISMVVPKVGIDNRILLWKVGDYLEEY